MTDKSWQEKLIVSVQKRKVLYELTDKEYKNEFKKSQVWDIVGEETGFTGIFYD